MKKRSNSKITAFDLTLMAMMVAVIEVSKVALANIPNVELTSFWIIMFTLFLGKHIFFVIPVVTLIEGAIYGFGIWWVMYLYAWPLLTLVAHLCRKNDSAFFWAIISGAYGLLFGLLCSFPYFFIGASAGGAMMGLRQMMAWWVAGIPFDLMHCAGNFVTALVLFKPLTALFRRLLPRGL